MNKHILYILSLGILLSPFVATAGTVLIGTITPNAETQADTNISFQLTTVGFIGTPKYILSDTFPGSTLSNSNINLAGLFNWTPSQLDAGTHSVTITAVDSYNNRGTAAQNFVVRPASPVSIQSLSSSTVFPGNAISFSVSASGYVNPQFSITDSYSGSSINNSNINSDGNFSWTPTKNDVGVHNLTIRVTTPSGRSDTVYQALTVNGISIRNNSGSRVVSGSSLSFTVTPYGLGSFSYYLSDQTRNNTIETANVSDNVFTWIPKDQDIGTHTLTVNAVDSNGNLVSNQIVVTVISSVTTSTVSPSIPTTPVTPPKVTTTAYTFTLALQVGSSGKEVLELQKKLLAEGYFSGPTTGTFGPLTKAAVIKYQKAKGISAIGSVGPATRAALNKK